MHTLLSILAKRISRHRRLLRNVRFLLPALSGRRLRQTGAGHPELLRQGLRAQGQGRLRELQLWLRLRRHRLRREELLPVPQRPWRPRDLRRADPRGQRVEAVPQGQEEEEESLLHQLHGGGHGRGGGGPRGRWNTDTDTGERYYTST